MDAEESLTRLTQAVTETAKSAQEHLDRGADPDDVAKTLARMSDGLPDGVKVAQIGTLGKHLEAGQMLQALEALGNSVDPETLREALARLQALLPKATDSEGVAGPALSN